MSDLRKCRSCGFPRKFARYFTWHSDGTIVNTENAGVEYRITFLEAGELEGVFDTVSSAIGVPLDPIIIEAEKNVGKEFFEATPLRVLKHAPRNPHLRRPFIAKSMVRLVRVHVAGLGGGIIRADSYRGGCDMVLRIRNPVFAARTVGDSLGIYESIERIKSADYSWHIDESGELEIRMAHPEVPEEPLSETRLFLERLVPGDGKLRFESCEVCGVPLAAADLFAWVIDEGLVLNRKTGRRELLGATQSVDAIVRELERELGAQVLDMLYDAQREYSRLRLKELEAGEVPLWEEYLFELGLRGLGHPEHFKTDGRSVFADIRNAYCEELYAGKLAALFEVSTGQPSYIEWENRYRRDARFTILPY